jgi:hypothetical protein
VKALFFSPFSNVWEHSFPETLVAESLKDRGIDITLVRCDGLYESFCVAMSAAGLTASDDLVKKRQVCGACRKRRDLLNTATGFPSLNLENYLTPEDFKDAAEIARQVGIDAWPELELDGIPVGRYAAYEFLLHYKILGTAIPEELFPVYREQLRICVLTLRASQRVMADTSPDVVLTYNRLYGVNHSFLVVAERVGIPTYTLQGGAHITHRVETMTMFRNSETYFDIFEKDSWIDYKNRPIGVREIDLVNSHFDGLMEASSAFAYSSAFKAAEPDALRARFGIPADAPVLLIPMSSEDELNAAQLADFWPDTSGKPNVFDDQFAWIRFIFEFAKERPQYRFVLRLHPRMFPNKRENVVAPVVALVMDLIEEAPDNVVVNFPSDDVSIYDLLQIVDVLLGYRSTVGAEFAGFGIPVVAPANKDFFTYPDEVSRIGETEEDFARLIDEAVNSGWSIENMRIVYRWFAFQFSRVSVDFSGAVNARPSTIRPKKPGLRLWLWRKAVFLIIQFGPLIRERIALRSRSVSDTTKDILADVIENNRGNLAESVLWPPRASDLNEETRLLRRRLSHLTQSTWKEMKSQSSLASRVREYLRT